MLPQYTPTDKDVQRFWKKVDQSGGPDACWLWTGTIVGSYGKFGYQHIVTGAHRFMWIITHGTIPDGLEVCHRCDNPSCVNPVHLFAGTHKENMHDMVRKKRNKFRRGSDNNTSKLKAEQVLEIRSLYRLGRYNQYELARQYGVSQVAINRIIHRRDWKHLPD